MAKKTKVQVLSDIIGELKFRMAKVDQDLCEQIKNVESHADVTLFSSQVSGNIEALAERNVDFFSKVDLLKDLDLSKLEDDLDPVFEYVELLYSCSVKKEKYNQYLNVKAKQQDLEEHENAKKSNKTMRKMLPIFKRILASVDKDAVKELVDTLKTFKSKEMSKTFNFMISKLVENNLNIDEAFKDFDIGALGLTEQDVAELGKDL